MTVLIKPKDIVKKQAFIISKVLKNEILKKEFEDNRTEFYYEHLKSKLCIKDGRSKELKILGTSINLNILKKAFKKIKSHNEILLNKDLIFGTKMSADRDKKELLKFLPIGVIKEEKGIIRLKRELF